jgi:SAM-dependent methyltransferase
MTRPLVFVSCGPTTQPLLVPLAARFTLVVPYAATVEALARHGIKAVVWSDFGDPDLPARAAAEARRMGAAWRTALGPHADRLSTFGGTRDGAGFAAAAAAVVERRLAEQLHVLELGRAMAATGQLAAVVVHEDVTCLVRAFLAGVRAAGVPAVHVPHGVYADHAVRGADVHGAVHSDVIAVGGPVQRDWFVERGVDADRLVVTGNPAWDRWYELAAAPPPALDVPAGPIVTVATSWIGGEMPAPSIVAADQERRLRACLGAVAAVQAVDPRVRLVLKLHPSAPPEEEARLGADAAAAGARVALATRGRLPDVLRASDVVCTLPSTLAIESVLAGTPVVVQEFRYAGDAIASVACTPEAIAGALRQALDGWKRSDAFAAARRDFAARYDGPADGRATARVADLVGELAERTAHVRGALPSPDLPIDAARARLAAGDPAGALRLLDGLTDGGEIAAELLMLRGKALARTRRGPEAEAALRAAVAAGAGAAAHAELGSLLLERQARGEAAEHLARAAALDPASDAAWAGLGVLAALEGRNAEAADLLARALATNPANADARAALTVLGETASPADSPPDPFPEEPGVELPEYYRQCRPELLDELLPPLPRRVLEVGCAAGFSGAELKRRHPGCEVIGVERDAAAAAAAAARLDRVIAGDVETLDLAAAGVAPGSLDAILYGDVLEHLVDPWRVLAAHVPFLAEGGRAIVSLPNVRYCEVLLGLLRGRWEYAAAGVLDRGHLRFFTRQEGARLLTDAGLRLVGTRDVYWQPADDLPASDEGTAWIELEEFRIAGLRADDVRDLYAGQIVYVGERGEAVEPWPFPDGHAFHALAIVDGPEGAWRTALATFARTFPAGTDTAIVLAYDPAALDADRVEATVRATLAEIGLRPETSADVVLDAVPATADATRRCFRAAHVVLGAEGALAAVAAEYGCRPIAVDDGRALHAAWAAARTPKDGGDGA